MNRFIVKKQQGYSRHCDSPDMCSREGCRCPGGSSYFYYEIYDKKKQNFVYKYEGNQATLREIARRLNKRK